MVKKTDPKKELKALKASLKRQYDIIMKSVIDGEKIKYAELKRRLKREAPLNNILTRKNVKDGCVYFRQDPAEWIHHMGGYYLGKYVNFKPESVLSCSSKLKHKLSEEEKKDLPAVHGMLCVRFNWFTKRAIEVVLLDHDLQPTEAYMYHVIGNTCCVGDLTYKIETLTLTKVQEVLAFLDEVIEMYKTPDLGGCITILRSYEHSYEEKKAYDKFFRDERVKKVEKENREKSIDLVKYEAA